MERLLHFRGDITGMLVFFFAAFLGAWQLLIAFYKLNGLSLTGYPDRSCISTITGAVLIAGSCSWYFSSPGHFASPDVEGVETLILLLVGFLAATFAQVVLASIVGGIRRRLAKGDNVNGSLDVTIAVQGVEVPGSFRPASADIPEGEPVLLLHDYGGNRSDVAELVAGLAASGSPVLSVDLEGHGDNPLKIDSPEMKRTLDAAALFLGGETGGKIPAAVGVGLGGTLALDMLGRGVAARAVAIDPPARDEEGYVAVNVLCELGPLEVFRTFLRPPARSDIGQRISLSKLIRDLPRPFLLPEGKVLIVGTADKWLNSPDSLARYARMCGVDDIVWVDTNHSSLTLGTVPIVK